MNDAQHHLETLQRLTRDRQEDANAASNGGFGQELLNAEADIMSLAYAIRAIEERDELLKLIREVEAYGAPRFNRAISDLIARIEQCEK